MSTSEELFKTLSEKGLKIAAAESVTGGLVASGIIDTPGASAIIEYSVVAYSDRAKAELLGVSRSVLDEKGAVSHECASEMAKKIREISGADIGIATTGYAGPDGDEVGKVYISVSDRKKTTVYKYHFTGTRDEIREDSAKAAIRIALRASLEL